MGPLHLIMVAGALFKRKVTPPPVEDKAKESIRKKVDDLREREDALRDKEAALGSREEKLAAREGEMARRVQEIAVKESELKAKLKAAPEQKEGPKAQEAAKGSMPGDVDDIDGQAKVVGLFEERLVKARAKLEQNKAREEKRKEFSAKLEEYRAIGISVARLQAVMKEGIEDIKSVFEGFEADLGTLAGLVDRIDAVDRVFAQQADALKARCTDPDAIDEIENGLKELEAASAAKRKEMTTQVEKWKNEGYSVVRFEKLPATLSEFEDAITHYEEDLEVLRMFAEKLGSLDKAFAEEGAELKKHLKDPDAISAMENGILAIEQKVGSQRQEFTKILENWKGEGYNTSDLEKVLQADLVTLRQAFLRFEEDIRKLKGLEARAGSLDKAFTPQIQTILANLRDPTVLQKIELAIQGLEEETARRKAAYRTKADDLKSRGYDTTRLGDVLSGDLATIEKGFAAFEADIKKLDGLLPRIEVLEKESRYPDDIKGLRSMLLEPGAHIRLEKKLLELEERLMADKDREEDEKRKAAREAAERERREQMEKERGLKDKVERGKAEKERLERERLQREQEEREKLERERLEKERLQKEKDEKERLEREETERARKAQEEKKPPAVQAQPQPPAQPAPAAAGGSLEDNVKAQILASENIIKDLETNKVNVTSASNYLKLARSFSRSKNYEKALQYAKKALDEASNLKK